MVEPGAKPTWTVGSPVARRKSPWLSGSSWQGMALRKSPDGLTTLEAKPCGHRHTNRTTALACGARLAKSLSEPT